MYHKDDPSVQYAVKVYTKNNAPDAQVRHFKQEQRLKNITHPYIIKMIDYNENGKCSGQLDPNEEVMYAVLELAPNGNLLDYISHSALPENIVRYYFKQLCYAVDYMHKQDICHRDLKLENLLLDKDFDMKLSDFGFWTKVTNQYGDSKLTTCKGTPGYMAPEMMNIGGFNYVTNQKSNKFFDSNGYNGVQTDIFAMGVILFSLRVGRPPFKIADINDPFYRLIFTQQISEFWKPWDQFATSNNFELSQEFKDLFISLVSFSPLMRLSINEILGSKWMGCNAKSSSFPNPPEVKEYMSHIKSEAEEEEKQEQMCFENTLQTKLATSTSDPKKQIQKSNENSNDSSLSDCSQMNEDDDLQIMSDLQDIENELYENWRSNDDEYEFNVDSGQNSYEFNIDENTPEDKEEDLNLQLEPQTKDVKPESQQDAIIKILEEMTEVDAEVRTSVPDKMLTFLWQYGQMNDWKIVQISNYLLLKIPDSELGVVEYALKFDQENESQYALKFLKNESITDEVFHSVGWFLLNLLSPYC